jgi:hypothetical protein
MSVMNRPLFRANGGPASGGRSEAEIRSEIRELDQLVKNEVISQARADHDMKLLVRELQQAPLMMMDSVKKNKENLGRFLKLAVKDVNPLKIVAAASPHRVACRGRPCKRFPRSQW